MEDDYHVSSLFSVLWKFEFRAIYFIYGAKFLNGETKIIENLKNGP